jgi:hypothetical protein
MPDNEIKQPRNPLLVSIMIPITGLFFRLTSNILYLIFKKLEIDSGHKKDYNIKTVISIQCF